MVIVAVSVQGLIGLICERKQRSWNPELGPVSGLCRRSQGALHGWNLTLLQNSVRFRITSSHFEPLQVSGLLISCILNLVLLHIIVGII